MTFSGRCPQAVDGVDRASVRLAADGAERHRLIDEVQHRGEIEFVTEFAAHVPLIVISEMMGLDPARQEEAAHLADGMVSWNDADVARGREPGEVINDSLVGLLTMAGRGRAAGDGCALAVALASGAPPLRTAARAEVSVMGSRFRRSSPRGVRPAGGPAPPSA